MLWPSDKLLLAGEYPGNQWNPSNSMVTLRMMSRLTWIVSLGEVKMLTWYTKRYQLLASDPTWLVMERGLLEYTFPASPEVSPVLAVPIAYWGNSFVTLSIWGSVAELVLSSGLDILGLCGNNIPDIKEVDAPCATGVGVPGVWTA